MKESITASFCTRKIFTITSKLSLTRDQQKRTSDMEFSIGRNRQLIRLSKAYFDAKGAKLSLKITCHQRHLHLHAK
jgi:hypothetical protein